jgi:hypothetical protein
MPVGPDRTPTVLLVLEMMDEAKDRLEEQQDEDDDPDDRMISVQEVVRYIVDHPDTKTKGNDVHNVGKELEGAVDEPYAAECPQTDHNGSHWEEEDEGEGGQDAVGDQDLLPAVDERLRRLPTKTSISI